MLTLIVFVICAAVFALFALSQIIYPLFSALPRARKLARDDRLVRPIPASTFLIAPIMWGALVLGSIWLVSRYFADLISVYYGTLGFILVVVILQIPAQNRDLENDFTSTWGQYLKKPIEPPLPTEEETRPVGEVKK